MEFDLEEEYHRYMTCLEQIYHCQPLFEIGKSHLEDGDKVIMPLSALDRLKFIEVDFPMLFEIQNLSTGSVSHCGVLEFTADEGFVFIPTWMMNNLGVEKGQLVRFKSKSLEKGSFIRLQPHAKDFMLVPDIRKVLERSLNKFSCLTTGDTIMVMHENQRFYINVLETKPSNAVSIVETDCEVEVAPLDIVTPQQKVMAKKEEKQSQAMGEDKEKAAQKKPKLVPFTGVSRRLDEEPSTNGMLEGKSPDYCICRSLENKFKLF